jgi:hypothetical protein
MVAAMTQPPMLRPLAIGEIIDAGIKIYRRNWRVLLGITATIVIPLHILTFGLTLVAAQQVGNLDELDFMATDFDPTIIFSLIGVAILSGLISLLALLIVNAAALRAVADGYMGLNPDRNSSLALAIQRLGTLIGNTLLQVLAIGAIFVLPIVMLAFGAASDGGTSAIALLVGILAILTGSLAAIWLGISWTVAVPAIMVERSGAAEALGRSMRLIRGRWWPVFGVIILVAIIRSVIGAVTGIGSGIVFFAAPDNLVLTAVVDTLQSILTDLVLLPFAAAITAVLYFDLRVRKEGFDLELLARSIGSDWSGTAATPPTRWTPPPVAPPADPSRWSAQPPVPPSPEEPQSPAPPAPGGSPWDRGPTDAG